MNIKVFVVMTETLAFKARMTSEFQMCFFPFLQTLSISRNPWRHLVSAQGNCTLMCSNKTAILGKHLDQEWKVLKSQIKRLTVTCVTSILLHYLPLPPSGTEFVACLTDGITPSSLTKGWDHSNSLFPSQSEQRNNKHQPARVWKTAKRLQLLLGSHVVSLFNC